MSKPKVDLIGMLILCGLVLITVHACMEDGFGHEGRYGSADAQDARSRAVFGPGWAIGAELGTLAENGPERRESRCFREDEWPQPYTLDWSHEIFYDDTVRWQDRGRWYAE